MREPSSFYIDNFLGWLDWLWHELTDWQAWCLSLRERLRKQREWVAWQNSQWRITPHGEAVRIINPGKAWKKPSRLARWIMVLLSLLLLSGCDALEARRLNAEAAASRAKAAEISAVYTGRAAETEAETAQIIAKQQAEEEERESLLAAEVQRSLLRQAALDRQAARRTNDLALLALVTIPVGLPMAVAAAVVFFVWRRGQQQKRRTVLYRQICQLQRQRQLKPGMTPHDVDAILRGEAQLSWYIVAPAVAELPNGEDCGAGRCG